MTEGFTLEMARQRALRLGGFHLACFSEELLFDHREHASANFVAGTIAATTSHRSPLLHGTPEQIVFRKLLRKKAARVWRRMIGGEMDTAKRDRERISILQRREAQIALLASIRIRNQGTGSRHEPITR